MRFHFTRILPLAAATTLVATLASAQSGADFTRIVSVGDSLTAGYQSASLYVGSQEHSFGALFAHQAGAATYAQPTISEPGIPAQLELKRLIPATLGPKSGFGAPTNLTYPAPYNNLGIPGARIHDILATTTVCNYQPGPTCPNPYYDLILRNNPLDPTRPIATAIQLAVAQQPTFAIVWVGSNDVLGAATNGAAVDTVTLTPVVNFEADLRAILAALRSNPNTKIVLANLGDVTSIPFVTTIPPYVVNPMTNQPVLDSNGNPYPLIGQKQGQPAGPLPAGTRVTLGASALLAQGIGIPTALGGTGLPLPDGGIVNGAFVPGVLLFNDELTQIAERTAQLNEKIGTIAAENDIPVVDINGILHDIADHGIIFGGIEFSSSFLTGGIYSYDGVHPNSFGYAVTANEFIKTVNAHYATSIPLVDLYPYVFGMGAEGYLVGSSPSFLYTQEAVDQVRRAFPPNVDAAALDLRRGDRGASAN